MLGRRVDGALNRSTSEATSAMKREARSSSFRYGRLVRAQPCIACPPADLDPLAHQCAKPLELGDPGSRYVGGTGGNDRSRSGIMTGLT